MAPPGPFPPSRRPATFGKLFPRSRALPPQRALPSARRSCKHFADVQHFGAMQSRPSPVSLNGYPSQVIRIEKGLNRDEFLYSFSPNTPLIVRKKNNSAYFYVYFMPSNTTAILSFHASTNAPPLRPTAHPLRDTNTQYLNTRTPNTFM